MSRVGKGRRRGVIESVETVCVALGVFGMLAGYLVFVGGESFVRRMTREDGVVESVGAVMFLLAGLSFLVAFLRSGTIGDVGGKRRRNVWYVLLCFAMLFVFLEEISWGQRLLNWRTPDLLRKMNRQEETNLHNLEWFHGNRPDGSRKGFWHLLYNADRLFSMFCIGFAVVLPVANRVSGVAGRAIKKVRLPVVSLAIGILFLVSYGASKCLEAAKPELRHQIVETKESIAAWLLFCLAYVEAIRMKSKAGSDTPAVRSSEVAV
jgi:hypothetical protein